MTKIGEKCLCHYSLCYKGLGMNTSPEQNRIATQLEIAAQVLRTNHPWEFREGGKWVLADPKVFPVLQLLMRDYEIRLTLATPPDKRPLHNPDNLTAEQVGAGYRLILLGEPFNPKAEYMERKDRWLATIQSSEYNLHFTYRLPLSTPWPEVEKPLPTPPPGTQWHRLDGWKEGDLPQGWRPLVAGEKRQSGDEYRYRTDPSWSMCQLRVAPNSDSGELYRTTRPLVFEHAGKEWTWHRAGDPMPCDGEARVDLLLKDCSSGAVKTEASKLVWGTSPLDNCQILGWRYADKPEPREVDLGPEDVPPMSIFKRESWDGNKNWLTVSQLTEGFVVLLGDEEHVTFEELRKEGYLINRPRHRDADGNPTLWEPCSKKVEG